MTHATRVAGIVFLVLGLFWAGRESGHGIAAFWEHWWCPLPLVAILFGVSAVLAGRLTVKSQDVV
jgi:hypothetical protein